MGDVILEPERVQAMKLMIRLVTMMPITEHVFRVRWGCLGPGPCTEARGKESRAESDPVSREECLEEVECTLSLEEPLYPGRFRAGSERKPRVALIITQ